MRWKSPGYHDTKTKKKFLWLPLCIDGEWRWLERATIEYAYSYIPAPMPYGKWEPVAFVD